MLYIGVKNVAENLYMRQFLRHRNNELGSLFPILVNKCKQLKAQKIFSDWRSKGKIEVPILDSISMWKYPKNWFLIFKTLVMVSFIYPRKEKKKEILLGSKFLSVKRFYSFFTDSQHHRHVS